MDLRRDVLGDGLTGIGCEQGRHPLAGRVAAPCSGECRLPQGVRLLHVCQTWRNEASVQASYGLLVGYEGGGTNASLPVAAQWASNSGSETFRPRNLRPHLLCGVRYG